MARLLIPGAMLFAVLAAAYALHSDFERADLTYVNPSGIHTLDPARMSWTQDFRVALNLWEGLTTWHPQTTEPIGGAAHFPPEISDDRLTYRFTIRDDARWSNGDPVTSYDFIRGWRRGMEPGTATDYTFLFTKHFVGAQGYVQWRQRGVAELTALVRLRDGWDIDAEQAHALAAGPSFNKIRSAVAAPTAVFSDASGDALARYLNDASMDWDHLYDEAFETHVAELDARFMQVGFDTPDERTVVIHLRSPCPYLLDLAASPIFLPCHASVELLRTRYRGAPITEQGLVIYNPQWTKPAFHNFGYPGLITNGPYQLYQWIFKQRARLVVNPHYREADTLTCRTVDMLVYGNISAAITAYESGHVDFLPAMNVSYDHEIARLARTGERSDFHLCDVLATYFLSFNCVSKTLDGEPNPFRDPRVRRAFTLAIDREGIVTEVLRRGDRVAHSLVPPDSLPGYDPPCATPFDPQRARRSLAAAGFPHGQKLPPIDFLYTSRDQRVAQALARMWERELGVSVELRSQESKTFAEDKAAHRFMIARGNWYADYADPTTFLDCLASDSGNNDSGYASTRYDALLAGARRESDPAARFTILHEAESLLVREDFPILPVFHYAEPVAIAPYVSGLYPNRRMWFPFKYVHIDK